MGWPAKDSRKEIPASFGRVIRWCKKCERRRHFTVRQKADGRQVECLACARRRGQAQSPTRVTWRAMKDRCRNPNVWNYKYYGGRGITIHPPWIESFAAFLADVGERPTGKTLDRKDVEGNYEPGNVRWAWPKEQIANRLVSYGKRRHRKQIAAAGGAA